MRYLYSILFFSIFLILNQCKQNDKKESKSSQLSSFSMKSVTRNLVENIDYCTLCNDDIKLALKCPDSVTSLILSAITNEDLTSIGRFRKLETINIIKSPSLNFDMFFQQLSKLTYLKQITIQECRMHALPHSLTLLKGLESLMINDTLNIPFNGFSNLVDLKELGIVCTWNFCKGIEKLKKLTILDLWIVDENTMPKEIFQLSNLKKIRLSGNVEYIPCEVKKLKNLESLRILTVFSKVKPVSKRGYILYFYLKRELPQVNVSIAFLGLKNMR